MAEQFKALLLTQQDGNTQFKVAKLTEDQLPEGDVLLGVEFSSLNFKDALAITGKGKIVRDFPMVPGIDSAGTVLESRSPKFRPGDRVVLTGWGVGERYWGGYSQRQRARGEWLVPLPDGLDSYRAMAIGTAGFTGMLCVMTLQEAGITPNDGPVLVTGAAGGVGSVAVSVLSKLGYRVAALTATGQEHTHDYLRALGAAEIVPASEWAEPPRPLETQRWTGAVDTVGGIVLARALAQMNYGGCIANCGLAGSADLPATVMPFILRGVSLRGVDSVMCPTERRIVAWNRLLADLRPEALNAITRCVPLAETPTYAHDLLAGKVRGRVVVDVNA
jgi:acrylyl-CoA reductase (NADPH)